MGTDTTKTQSQSPLFEALGVISMAASPESIHGSLLEANPTIEASAILSYPQDAPGHDEIAPSLSVDDGSAVLRRTRRADPRPVAPADDAHRPRGASADRGSGAATVPRSS